MRIIDNRYKIEESLNDTFYYESYKVIDLWEGDKIQLMKLYNHNIQNQVIDYFSDNFIHLSNIRHEYLLSSESFNLVKTIDTKKTNMLLYYSIVEYVQGSRLSSIKDKLNFHERLKIILDIMVVIDFLHFRGFIYKLLNPLAIFITEDKTMKLMDLPTNLENRYGSNYDDLSRYFILPETLIDKEQDDKNTDYFSIGVLIKYLFLRDFTVDDVDSFIYGDFLITEEQKEVLNSIIKQLTKRDFINKDLNLMEIVDRVVIAFNFDYSYDLVKDRNVLHFNNKIIGRKNEIKRFMSLDDNIARGTNDLRGLVLNGDLGVGKTRFLREISFKLKMKGRDVYFVEIHDDQSNHLLDMANILKQSIKDTSPELINKYRSELSKILPELRLNIDEEIDTDLSQRIERFRLYNRIANYFTELSKDKIIYIIVDDIQKCNTTFIMILDYLIQNTTSNNLFFVFSYDKNDENIHPLVKEKIEQWEKEVYIQFMNSHKLNLEEIGELVKSILGISYVPYSLASVLFRESKGNPRRIEYIIKHLFNTGELYMKTSGRWYLKVDDYDDLSIQPNVEDDFSKQLNIIKENYFKENYFDIFKVMSIFSDKLHKRILLEMLEIEQHNIEDALNELINLKLIDEKVADWGYSYNINGSELKRLIYNQISEEEKTALHTKAAKVIQDLDDRLILEELIYHLIKSNQNKKALDIVFNEIEKLENKYGSQAKFLLQQSYNIVKDNDSEEKLEVLEGLVNIYYLKDETDKGKAYLEEYQKTAKLLKNFDHIIKSKFVIIDINFRKGEKEKALQEVEVIEKISKENNIVEGQIMVLATKARFGISNGELKEAEKYLNEGIKLSQNNGNINCLGILYNRLGLIKHLSGNTKEAIKDYKKSIFYYEAIGNFMDVTRPINNIGIIYADYYANNQKAMEYYKKGLTIAKSTGLQEVETVFLNNIAELYIMDYKFDDALRYMEESKQGSLELQDFRMTILVHINLGTIYLATSEYTKAYGCYLYLKEVFESKEIFDFEINVQYHEFLGEFYGCFGQWEKAIESYNFALKLSHEVNARDYLRSKLMIICFTFLKESTLNIEEVEELRNSYRNTEFIQDRRKALLYLSIICLLNQDRKYALNLIEEDTDLVELVDIDFLHKIREIILYALDLSDSSIENLIFMEEETDDGTFSLTLYLNTLIGFVFYSRNKYKEAIKYLLDSLDRIYRLTLKIPDSQLKFSYIKSKKGDLIKEKIVTCIKNEYNREVNYPLLEEVNEKDLNYFFDITSMIDVIGSEEFVKITKLDYLDNVLDINTTEELISRFTDDFKHNLDIILNYLGKETFAKKGYILGYDDKEKDYVVYSSLDDKSDYKINKDILSLTDKHKMGILINSNFQTVYNQNYKEFLSNDKKGIICVPIFKSNESVNRKIERRKIIYEESRSQGYIYLETDKVFNRFDIQRLELVKNLSSLAFINLENNKLKLMAIQDKLTGVFTRKYYEGKLVELINHAKSTNGNFSILLLDIDKFKNINDTYGHRKGDQILALIGEVLKSTVRTSDIVARYGGEEFIILIKNTKEYEAKKIAEKIRKNVENLKIKGIEHSITISIGISLYPHHSQFKEELVEKADQALYHAKETGRNKSVIWNPQMDNTINRVDKLAGILTGNTEDDNRNILALINTLELIKENQSIEKKTFKFLGRVLETLDAEWGSIIFIDDGDIKRTLSRARFNDSWIENIQINHRIIDRILYTQKGEFLIDWDNIDNIDFLTGLPNWQSVIILPLINNGQVKGILYISTAIKNKEFDFDDFNLSKNFGNIFSAII